LNPSGISQQRVLLRQLPAGLFDRKIIAPSLMTFVFVCKQILSQSAYFFPLRQNPLEGQMSAIAERGHQKASSDDRGCGFWVD
jgi:hypothetical protein